MSPSSGLDSPTKLESGSRPHAWKHIFTLVLLSCIPLVGFIALSEATLAALGIGTPPRRTAHFWSRAMDMMQPDPYCGIRMKPGYKKGKIRLNSLGLLDDEIDPTADIKILSLGDSCAFGWGLDRRSWTYAALLQRYLSRRINGATTNRKVEVLNGGVPSYTVYQGLQLYLHYLQPIARWDVVVVSFGWNERPGKELDLEFALRHPPLNDRLLRDGRDLARHLRLYNALESLFFRASIGARNDPYLLAQAQFGRYYAQLIRSAQSAGARVVALAVITRPGDQSLRVHRMRVFNGIAKRVAARAGACWLDLNESFVRHRDAVGWFDDFHYDRRGHQIVARALADLLATCCLDTIRDPEGSSRSRRHCMGTE